MRKILWIIVILNINVISGQDFDKVMKETKILGCSDISRKSGLLFVKYLEEGKLDSAKKIIDYWKGECGEREPVFRAKILLALVERNYSDSLLNQGIMNYIYDFQYRQSVIINADFLSYDSSASYYGFIPPGQKFDKATKAIASELKEKYPSNSMEFLLAEFYSGETDRIFNHIQKDHLNTTLAKEYAKTVKKYMDMSELHRSWITGLWIPTGDLKTIGTHPSLGFQIGSKVRKMNYDLTFVFKFLKAENSYVAYRDGVPELTDDFFGGYIGFDVGRDIYTENGHEIQLTGGIAADGFDALDADDELDLDSETAWTYNFNFGLGYRFYIKNSFYIGLRAKYNVVDYSLNKVTDFSGKPFTLQFMIGGVSNPLKNDNLKELGYKLRR